MRNKCANCAKKLMKHIWILISWLINAVCGFVSFIYRNDTEKTAKVILIEKILISLSNLLAILDVPICCKVTTNTTNKDPIEEGKNLLSLISDSKKNLELLKELAANGNKEAEKLLKYLNSAGQAMINNIK
jgi:hypothetical protein